MRTHTIENATNRVQELIGTHRPVVVLAQDYEAGEKVPCHDHAKAQLIYAIEGSLLVSTHTDRWALISSRAIWVPAHTPHYLRMRSKVRMRTAYFEVEPTPAREQCAVISVSPLLRDLILALLHEPRQYEAGSRGAHMAALILSEVQSTNSISPLHLPWPEDPRLKKLCEAMLRRPHLGADMEYWAAKLEISTRSLGRLFRSELKMTFQEWRSQLLLMEAQIRLSELQPSLRVARALGYESHAAFSAMFRRVLGMTPREYVKNVYDGLPASEHGRNLDLAKG
jgi:AraC-like DNA-binding protein/quercetin dioxygenase-like cupin family protein